MMILSALRLLWALPKPKPASKTLTAPPVLIYGGAVHYREPLHDR